MRVARVGGRAVAAFGATAAIVLALGGAASATPAGSPAVTDNGSSLAPSTSAFTPAGYLSNFTSVPSGGATLNVQTLKVPTITCKATGDTAPVFDTAIIYGTTSGSVFDAAAVTVGMSCSGTTPSYNAFGSVDGNNSSNVTVNAGDSIGIALIASPTFETASFGDSNTGGGTFIDGTGFNATGAAVQVQGGTGTGHFPRFTAARFGGIQLNGKNLGHWPTTAHNQLDATGNTEIAAGPLSVKGNSFADTFVANH
jgi:hypothetical protein